MNLWKLSMLLLLLGPGFAWAGDGASTRQGAQTSSNRHCAVYGPGYFAVKGSDTCIKISGYISAGTEFSSGPTGAAANDIFNPPPSSHIDTGLGVASDMRFETAAGPGEVSIAVRRGPLQHFPLDAQ